MRFGTTFNCHICNKEIVGDFHRYTSDMLGMDFEFYVCQGECNNTFRGDYVEPYEPVESRWQILDL